MGTDSYLGGPAGRPDGGTERRARTRGTEIRAGEGAEGQGMETRRGIGHRELVGVQVPRDVVR